MTIKKLRDITGLSQKAFGEKYHIPKRSIENWEGGQRKPSETIIYLLERAVKEDYMKGYVLIDDCMSSKAEVFDEAFESKEEALKAAEAEWDRLTAHDKKQRDAFYVARCEFVFEDDDRLVDWDSIEPIKEYK